MAFALYSSTQELSPMSTGLLFVISLVTSLVLASDIQIDAFQPGIKRLFPEELSHV